MKQHTTVLYVSMTQDDPAPLIDALKSAGCHVDQVATDSALQNVQVVVDHDAILFDEPAPAKAAFQLLRALQEFSAPPLLFLTDSGEKGWLSEAYKLGISEIIYKDAEGVYLELLPQALLKQIQLRVELLSAKGERAALRAENHELRLQNEELAAFSDSVAHDLKNPITHFLTYADFLREHHTTLKADEMSGYIDIILRQSRKMHEIIDILLLLARVRGEDEMERTRLNMAHVLDGALERLDIEIREANAHIDVPAVFPSTVGYAPWVETVWVNYLSNGIKYGGKPPVLSLGCAADSGDQVRFWVADAGEGLSGEEQALLFYPFPKIRRPKEKRGNGLGLSIVKRIIERLDGRVGVESEPGKGACFYFTLPSG